MSTTLTVDFFCSLDGNGSAEGWPGYWGKEGPELIADRVRTFSQDQVLVFGATTFREFSTFVGRPGRRAEADGGGLAGLQSPA